MVSFILDVGPYTFQNNPVRTNRGHTGGMKATQGLFFPPSFCGACLETCCEKKDSAVPSLVHREVDFFFRTHKIIAFHVVRGTFIVRKLPVRVTVPRFESTSKRHKQGYLLNHRPWLGPMFASIHFFCNKPIKESSDIYLNCVVPACFRVRRIASDVIDTCSDRNVCATAHLALAWPQHQHSI